MFAPLLNSLHLAHNDKLYRCFNLSKVHPLVDNLRLQKRTSLKEARYLKKIPFSFLN